MKNIPIYIAGVLTGVVLTILITILLGPNNNENTPIEKLQGITLFDEPGDIIEATQFKVFQVVDSGAALAFSINIGKESAASLNDKIKDLPSAVHMLIDAFVPPVVMLINDEGKLYYDDQIIKVSREQSARQMGVYQYSTESGYKTVPIVKIIK